MATLFGTFIGRDRINAVIQAYADAAKDLRPFWRTVFAPRYLAEVQDTFALEGQSRNAGGRFGGGHWAPLSPAYAAWKAKHFPNKRILQRGGALIESLQWTGHIGNRGIFQAFPDHAVIGTSVPYGRAHQVGRSRLPARPFLHTPDPKTYGPLLRTWLLRAKGGVA